MLRTEEPGELPSHPHRMRRDMAFRAPYASRRIGCRNDVNTRRLIMQ
jgi:hypothetical protein